MNYNNKLHRESTASQYISQFGVPSGAIGGGRAGYEENLSPIGNEKRGSTQYSDAI